MPAQHVGSMASVLPSWSSLPRSVRLFEFIAVITVSIGSVQLRRSKDDKPVLVLDNLMGHQTFAVAVVHAPVARVPRSDGIRGGNRARATWI